MSPLILAQIKKVTRTTQILSVSDSEGSRPLNDTRYKLHVTNVQQIDLPIIYQQVGIMKFLKQVNVPLDMFYHLTCLIITEKPYL